MAAVLHRSESGSFQALDVIGIWERSSRGWLRYAFAAFFPLFVSSFLNFHLLLFVSHETSAPLWTFLMYMVLQPSHLASGRALDLLHVQVHFPVAGVLVSNVFSVPLFFGVNSTPSTRLNDSLRPVIFSNPS